LLSSTRFSGRCLTSSIIARASSSERITYFGASLRSTGYNHPVTQ